jgi:hypothetical protein
LEEPVKYLRRKLWEILPLLIATFTFADIIFRGIQNVAWD